MLLFNLCFSFFVFAQSTPLPPLTGAVVDTVGLLKNSEQSQLSQLISEIYRSGEGPQFQIVIADKLAPDDYLESYSMRLVEHYKLGNAKRDDGVLLLILKGDRQLRIEVGQGLEGDIPDARASRAIRDILTPSFKNGDFAGGIAKSILYLIENVESLKNVEAIQEARKKQKPSLWTQFFSLLPVLLALLLLMVLNQLGLVSGHRGGHGGWNGPSGGSGGGWSGGGGGFSGGGASGRW